MSGRLRPLIFFALAGLTALTGAALADRYRQGSLAGYGELQEVVVTSAELGAKQLITPRLAGRRLTLRRVPSRFVAPGTVSDPMEVIGLRTVSAMPAGSYLTRSALRAPSPTPDRSRRGLSAGRSAVEIRVSGAGALLGIPGRPRVDVVVTSEPGPGGSGRTRVAAAAVPLLTIAPAGEEGQPGLSTATLGLTRAEALRLIRAEAFARSIRLLPRAPVRSGARGET